MKYKLCLPFYVFFYTLGGMLIFISTLINNFHFVPLGILFLFFGTLIFINMRTFEIIKATADNTRLKKERVLDKK